MAIRLYLKVNGIDGDVTTRGFSRWIEALSYSWANQKPASAPLESGLLQVTTLMGKHSVPLMKAMVTSQDFSDVRLAGTGQDPDGTYQQFMEIKLTSASLRAFDTAGSASASYPAEVWQFAYTRVETSYLTAGLSESWDAGRF